MTIFILLLMYISTQPISNKSRYVLW